MPICAKGQADSGVKKPEPLRVFELGEKEEEDASARAERASTRAMIKSGRI